MAHGNYQKYTSRNPLQRWLIRRFLYRVADLLAVTAARTVLDVGCAEGFVASYLRRQHPSLQVYGLDCDLTALARGRQLHPSLVLAGGDALTLPFPDAVVDAVVCTEVLEHIPAAERALVELCRVSRRWLILSVPWEPWFRVANALRFKNLSRWGDDPEHVHHWTGTAFRRWLDRYGQVIAHQIAFPWQVVLLDCR